MTKIVWFCYLCYWLLNHINTPQFDIKLVLSFSNLIKKTYNYSHEIKYVLSYLISPTFFKKTIFFVIYMVKTIPKRNCCETEDKKPTGAKKVVKKVFNFFFGCCKNKK